MKRWIARSYVKPDEGLFSKASASIEAFREAFPLEVVVRGPGARKRRYWGDQDEQILSAMHEGASETVSSQQEQQDTAIAAAQADRVAVTTAKMPRLDKKPDPNRDVTLEVRAGRTRGDHRPFGCLCCADLYIRTGTDICNLSSVS